MNLPALYLRLSALQASAILQWEDLKKRKEYPAPELQKYTRTLRRLDRLQVRLRTRLAL